MSILGVDVGTTGCKAVLFSAEGDAIASAYRAYSVQRPQAGWSELDSHEVWGKVKEVIAAAAAEQGGDAIAAVSVASLGEAMVPVSRDRTILGPSLLSDDLRGTEYVESLESALPAAEWFGITGNNFGNHFSLTKLMWIRDHQPDLYRAAYKFLHWGSFVSYMLGAEPMVDYSLANRSLFFDVNAETWSGRILGLAELDAEKFPQAAPAGTVMGTVSPAMAAALKLPPGTLLVCGAHDQCANAVGAGVIQDGRAMLGMGTYHIVLPTFRAKPEAGLFRDRGLNLEHHASPGQYVSFIFNPGGSIMQWFRDVCAGMDHQQALREGREVYESLMQELPAEPSRLLCLPHFSNTCTPDFISDSRAVIVGLRLETDRGDLLKGILEGIAFSLQANLKALPETGIQFNELRAVGGGSRSAAWVQLYADVFNCPVRCLQQPEAGALGVAVLAGMGAGVYSSIEEGVDAVVRPLGVIEPRADHARHYAERMKSFEAMWPLMGGFIRTGINSWESE